MTGSRGRRRAWSATLAIGLSLLVAGPAIARSPGRLAGTGPAADSFPDWTVSIGGTLFFSADDGVHGYELWKSDGTAAGTKLVKDINPGWIGFIPNQMTAVGARIFFAANDGSHGMELWKSDGTKPGTQLVKDISANGSTSSNPDHLVNVGGIMYFSASDGTHDAELWKTDGTANGTKMVKDIDPAGASGPEDLVNVAGHSTSPPTTARMASSYGRATAPRTARNWSRTSIPAGPLLSFDTHQRRWRAFLRGHRRDARQ